MITTSQANEQLRDFLPIMRDAWLFGWEEHLSRLHPFLTTSCRAQMIQNLAVGRAKEMLGEQVRYLDDQNTQLIIFPDISVVRFKKLSSALLPSNNHTRRSRGFYSQVDLPGVPAFPRLVCGIKVSSDWVAVDGVFLVQPKAAGAINWALDITHAVEEVDSDQLRLDLDDQDEPFFSLPDDNDEQQQLEQST